MRASGARGKIVRNCKRDLQYEGRGPGYGIFSHPRPSTEGQVADIVSDESMRESLLNGRVSLVFYNWKTEK